VLPGCFLGSGRDARDHRQLTALRIGLVLNFAGDEWDSSEAARRCGIAYRAFPLRDDAQEYIIPLFEEVVEVVHAARQAGTPLLLHCVVGKSRSPSFVLAYMMRREGIRLIRAMQYLRTLRDISPNEGFMQQLIRYEHRCFGDVSVSGWCSTWGGVLRHHSYLLPPNLAATPKLPPPTARPAVQPDGDPGRKVHGKGKRDKGKTHASPSPFAADDASSSASAPASDDLRPPAPTE
jgi:hypothetical protein